MEETDFVITGSGGAGLGLADALLNSPLQNSSILIVDKDPKQQNDRTWCFWGGPETPYTNIAKHSWQKLAIQSEGFQQIEDLSAGPHPDWRYWMVNGIDYYRHILEKLEQAPNVQFLQGSVDCIKEENGRVLVTVDGKTTAARWVFDSILRPGELKIDPNRHHFLQQHFKGWEIETEQAVFDPTCATLFDFGTQQKNDLRFFYILPFSETRALVEYTIFSSQLLPEEEYEAALTEYIQDSLGVGSYQIHSEEHGAIPMTDYPFQRRAGEHIMNIGTKGGLVKPSTGYAFKRMQQDAQATVASLIKDGHPFNGRRSSSRYRLYDTLLLQILYRQGQKMKPIFLELFANNPITRVFHFLDEDAPIFQDLALIASLPPGPFLKALFNLKIRRRL